MAIITSRDVIGRSKSGISAEEWKLRCDLAACYQLTELYGMYDMPGTHISARVPGSENHFLLNPYAVFFEEITASSLIKVDLDGNVIGGTSDQLNPAGFTIHSAIHMARKDLACVMHTHTAAINGVGAQEEGLLPITQKALTIWDFVAYHDFEGVALDLGERERIVRDVGEKGRCVILRNHGGLTVGETVAEAFSWMVKLEMACRYQLEALSGNRKLVQLSEATIKHTAAQGRKVFGTGGYARAGMEWPALIRKLERERGTSYRQ